MNFTHLAAFIAALQSIFKSGAGSMGLSERELFVAANEQCAPEACLSHTEYRAYADVFDVDDRRPAELVAAAYYEVYQCIRVAGTQHRNMMLNAIALDEPNWRRFCWLLARADKHNALDRKTRLAYLEEQNTQQNAPTMPEETPEVVERAIDENPQVEATELPTEAAMPLAALPEPTPSAPEPEESSTTPLPAKPQPAANAAPAKREAPKLASPTANQARTTHYRPFNIITPAPKPEEEAHINEPRYGNSNWGAKLKPHMESLFGRSNSTR